jgi:hypothetical protein
VCKPLVILINPSFVYLSGVRADRLYTWPGLAWPGVCALIDDSFVVFLSRSLVSRVAAFCFLAATLYGTVLIKHGEIIGLNHHKYAPTTSLRLRETDLFPSEKCPYSTSFSFKVMPLE